MPDKERQDENESHSPAEKPLHIPLEFEDALEALLNVKPPDESENQKKQDKEATSSK